MKTQTPFSILLNAVLAGIFIGIAGTVCMMVKNPIAGALFFGFGLLTILCFGFKLYTGAIGYLAIQKRNTPVYLLDLVLIWLGNFVGCALVGTLVRFSRSFPAMQARVEAICRQKCADNLWSLLILAFFCGILMYTAVEAFKRKELPEVCRAALVFLCVAVFILSGFEHCVANMYYFSAAGMWHKQSLIALGVMTLGNSIGGMLLPFAGHVQIPENK